MFRKLVSNLPFSPGLLNNLVFYAQRLRRENVTRQIGVLFLGLAVLVQTAFWVIPPVASVRAGENDIIYGGIGTSFEEAKANLLNAYRSDHDSLGRGGLQDLFTGTFGITEQDILGSVAHSVDTQDAELKSLGRNPYNKPGEVAVRTPAGAIYYLRPIGVWPWINRYQPALYFPSKDMYVLYDCGNIVTRHYPTPSISLAKTASPRAGTTVSPGDSITYSLTYRNSGTGSASAAVIKDATPLHAVRPAGQQESNPQAAPNGGPVGDTAYYYWQRSLILPGASETLLITFKVKSTGVADGDQLCNTASLEFSGGRVDSPRICHTIDVPDNPPPEEQPPPEQPPPTPAPDRFKRAQNLSVPESDPRHQDANQTTASAGDKIKYTLSTTNNADDELEDYQLAPEYIGDILDYVDEQTGLVDLGSATFNSSTKELSWAPVDIGAGETIERSFTVQIKNPIPTTPLSASDPAKFDLIMTNVYGNVIDINLPAALPKVIERTTGKLPNTGPGLTVGLSLATVAVATFLRARGGLLVRELGIIKKQQLGEET